MVNFWQDVRYGLRSLKKSPAFTITALISLALGIGATTAVFSVIHAVLMNPYPYAAANRIVTVVTQDKGGNENSVYVTGSQVQQLRDAKAVDSVLAQQDWELSTTGSDVPEDVRAVSFTVNATSFFGVPALLVAQRTNEFGIRIALGAKPRNVLGIVFASVTTSVGSGLVAGILMSLAFGKLMAGWAESGSRDPFIILGASLLLVCVSGLASFFPARRASSVDPMEALRHD
jgi:ABC-type antimicrobial peptide transport system permease subunit